jgi:hypothetical protein
MRILHLTLKKKWFDLVSSGEKKIEYRQIKHYWTTRIWNDFDNTPQVFSEVHFRNGYSKDAPFMRVAFIKITKNKYYEIHLGKILEIRSRQKRLTSGSPSPEGGAINK